MSTIKKNYKTPSFKIADKINGKKPRVVLLYSGGLDTSTILKYLVFKGYDVITLTADVGQQYDDLNLVKAKALKTGAIKAYVVDLKKEFVEDYVFPMLKTGAKYEGKYLMGCSPARAIISKAAVEILEKENVHYIAHGCTAKGNDTTRFMINCKSLNSKIQMIVPWGDEEFLSYFEGRKDLLEFAAIHNINVEQSSKKPYSTDDNIAYLSSESGILEKIDEACPDHVYKLVPQPYFKEVCNTPELINLHFKAGVPVKLEYLNANGKVNKTVTGSLELMLALNKLGTKHALGNTDIVETRVNGLKNHGVYQNPGAFIIHECHHHMQMICLDKEVMKLQNYMANEISYIIYEGFWYSPEFQAIMAFFDNTQQYVNGVVTARLYKGTVDVIKRSSPNSLYDEAIVSMDVLGGFVPADTTGYQKIKSIRIINWNAINKQSKKNGKTKK